MSKPKPRQYIAIDLKSFYASVECVERGLNPLDACLVVADASRAEKTICLAVSPALKAFGIPGRPRLFEVVQRVQQVNRSRGGGSGPASSSARELSRDPRLRVEYIVAPPRMQLYLDYYSRVYNVYLRHIAPEDIHVYSIDEVIIDATAYLDTYRVTAHELAMRMIRHVLAETGITATAGIGTNMYLAKVAMDIVAKKMAPDSDGVRIAELDELSYRRNLWTHLPLTDFWRLGAGTARRLQNAGMLTMGDVARASLRHEDWFYQTFGVNAELIIDHAWGYEPVTMDAVKAYRPATHSLSSGQVLQCPYPFEQALTVVKEMADSVALDLVDKNFVTDQLVLTVGYDVENLTDPARRRAYHGRVHTDHYGRQVPWHGHGTENLAIPTSSSRIIREHTEALFRRIADPTLSVRRLTLSVNHLLPASSVAAQPAPAPPPDLFTDPAEVAERRRTETEALEREHRRQQTIINLRRRFGKNALLTGLNFSEGATQKDRNDQIGGHHK